jgi:hypothetical protein
VFPHISPDLDALRLEAQIDIAAIGVPGAVTDKAGIPVAAIVRH